MIEQQSVETPPDTGSLQQTIIRRAIDLAGVASVEAFGFFMASHMPQAETVKVQNVAFTTLNSEEPEEISARTRYLASRDVLVGLLPPEQADRMRQDDGYFLLIENSGTAFLREILEDADRSLLSTKTRLHERKGGWTAYERALLDFERSRRDYFYEIVQERIGDAS